MKNKFGTMICDSGERSPDIFYRTGFYTTDSFIYFSVGKNEAVVLSPLEKGRAEKELRHGVKIFEYADFMRPGEDAIPSMNETTFRITKNFPAEEWFVPNSFPYGVGAYLTSKGVKLSPVSSELFRERRVKTDTQVKLIGNALAVAENAMGHAVEILKNSRIRCKDAAIIYEGVPLTSEFLISAINLEIVKASGIPAHTIAAGGKDSAEPHKTGSGTLYAETPIIIDIFPRMQSSGYWGDITRTFVKGTAPEIVRKAFEAVKDARDSSTAIIRESASPEEIYRYAVSILEKHGFKTGIKRKKHYGFFHSLGHGVGLEIHESPRISPKNQEPLSAGNVVTVEPGLYYPEWGGVRLEDLIVVKKNSYLNLTSFPTSLEIR